MNGRTDLVFDYVAQGQAPRSRDRHGVPLIVGAHITVMLTPFVSSLETESPWNPWERIWTSMAQLLTAIGNSASSP
jgi:hypothetical protein